jgi:hypothetical protein
MRDKLDVIWEKAPKKSVDSSDKTINVDIYSLGDDSLQSIDEEN